MSTFPDNRLPTAPLEPLTTYFKGAALREMREVRRDFVVYLQDRWNVLDVLSLVMLVGGFSVRFIDSGSPWGVALYALSAPLVFLRLLFYAQYLPFLGSMVEVSVHRPRRTKRDLFLTDYLLLSTRIWIIYFKLETINSTSP